jgi:hypothetical protein
MEWIFPKDHELASSWGSESASQLGPMVEGKFRDIIAWIRKCQTQFLRLADAFFGIWTGDGQTPRKIIP